jgi:SpoIID/LytB domain protein
MSQLGAYGYAADYGWSATQILNHYYGGTVSSTVSINSTLTVRLLSQNGRQTSVVHLKAQARLVGSVDLYRALATRQVAPGSTLFDVWGRTDTATCAPQSGDLAASGWTLVAAGVTSPVIESALDDGSGSATDQTDLLGLCEADGGVRFYRGTLRAVPQADPRNGTAPGTVNQVRVEQYLRSVISKEMSPDWGRPANRGMAALEAQAIAARSYALASNYQGGVATTCDTTRCQVYAGAARRAPGSSTLVSNEFATTDAAVAATAGQVRRVGNAAGPIALTMYAAASGGHTDKAPYLPFPAVVDLGDVKANSVAWATQWHRWTRTLSVTTVEQAWPQIGRLTGFTVLERNGLGEWGGRVRSIRVEGTAGQVTVTGDTFQSRMGLRSNWFQIDVEPARVCPGTSEPPIVGTSVNAPAARFAPLVPQRIVDTRIGLGAPQGKLGAGCTIQVWPGLPADATAAVVNITTTGTVGIGYVTAYPCGTPRPWVSMSQSTEGWVTASTAIVPLGADGSLCVYSPLVTNVVVDLFGYYSASASGRFTPVTPTRLADAPVAAERVLEVQVAGRGGVPATGVDAVALTIHAIADREMGYVTAYPCGTRRPAASIANALAGQRVANHAQVRLDASGRLCLFASGSLRLQVDVTGWFGPGGSSDYQAIQPGRVVDTRIGQGLPGRLPAGTDTPVQLTGRVGVPTSGVRAVIATVTYMRVDTPSTLTVHACQAGVPDLGMVRNLVPRHAATTALVAVDANGRWCTRSPVPYDLLVDVVGWYG